MSGEGFERSEGNFEAFNRYGLLHGHMVGVSRDTVTEDQRKPDDDGRQPPDDKNGHPQSGSPAYAARLQPDKTSLFVDGEERPLEPSMAVTAEIETWSRRIIDIVLSPLRAYRQKIFKHRRPGRLYLDFIRVSRMF